LAEFIFHLAPPLVIPSEVEESFAVRDSSTSSPVREPPRGGVEQAGVIDLFALDQKTDEILLAMNESRPWDGSDVRLHELQEKFNAYLSFLLDGEMTAAHPELTGKTARIELRCDYLPDDRALGLLNLIHDQIALQGIKMEVIVAERGCADSCSCHES
jgi:hypothetical protein